MSEEETLGGRVLKGGAVISDGRRRKGLFVSVGKKGPRPQRRGGLGQLRL